MTIVAADILEKDRHAYSDDQQINKFSLDDPESTLRPGGSDFLMKRLQNRQKYFDSGDYNMAKAKMKNKQLPVAGPDKNLITGDYIPTPKCLLQTKNLLTSEFTGSLERLTHF
ncbi:tolkin [Sarotherodon galilaeus]